MLLTRVSSLLVLLVISTSVFGQLPNKATKMVGVWRFNGGSGYEIWKMNGEVLEGEGYLKTKVGDTLHVEDMEIKLVNKNLIYNSYNIHETDSIIEREKSTFIGNGKKLKFDNLVVKYPNAIKYKIGFFNKKKLKIYIYSPVADKPQILRLTKITED